MKRKHRSFLKRILSTILFRCPAIRQICIIIRISKEFFNLWISQRNTVVLRVVQVVIITDWLIVCFLVLLQDVIHRAHLSKARVGLDQTVSTHNHYGLLLACQRLVRSRMNIENDFVLHASRSTLLVVLHYKQSLPRFYCRFTLIRIVVPSKLEGVLYADIRVLTIISNLKSRFRLSAEKHGII